MNPTTPSPTPIENPVQLQMPAEAELKPGKLPKIALILSAISIVLIVPAITAFTLAIGGLVGAKTPKDKKRSIIALCLSILPVIVFTGFSTMNINTALNGGVGGEWDEIALWVIITGCLLIASAIAPLIVGVLSMKKSQDQTQKKQGKVLTILGSLVLLLGIGLTAWVMTPSASDSFLENDEATGNVNLERALKKIVETNDSSTEAAVAAVVDARHYFQKKDYNRGESAQFGEVTISDATYTEVEFPEDYRNMLADGNKYIIVGFDREQPETLNDREKEIVHEFDNTGSITNLRLRAGAVRHKQDSNASCHRLMREASNSGNDYKYAQARLIEHLGADKVSEIADFGKRYRNIICYEINESLTPVELEYKREISNAIKYNRDLAPYSDSIPNELVWTLKI